MPKYNGKIVKVGDVIEVPARYRINAIGGGHIAATLQAPTNLTVVDEAPEVELGLDGKPIVKAEEKPLVLPPAKHAPAKLTPPVVATATATAKV